MSRTDRIGDVVLSTPAFRALKRARPDARVTVLARSGVHPVLAGLETVDELLAFDPAIHRGTGGVRLLASAFREHRFDAVVALFSEPVVAAAAFLARIPKRIGPVSKPHSLLFYNHGLRQRRSRVEKHEADYNLDLLGPLGVQVMPRTIFPEIFLSAAVRARAVDWLHACGWAERDRWVAMHPGMGGSALNWPEERYLQLAAALRDDGHRIVMTAGPQERGFVTRARATIGGDGVVYYESAAGGDVDFLAALYERMALVIAPSTGPLHLAVAAQTRVLSFYPNLRVQSVARWGPYAADPTSAAVLVPAVDCEADRSCMAAITVESALREARRLLQSDASAARPG